MGNENLLKLLQQRQTMQQNNNGGFGGFLTNMANVVQRTSNPNTDVGKALGGVANTYLDKNVQKNSQDFMGGVNQIVQNPLLQPNQKIEMLYSHASQYGQLDTVKDIIDAYGKMSQTQQKSAPVPYYGYDPQTGQPVQQGMVQANAKFAPQSSGGYKPQNMEEALEFAKAKAQYKTPSQGQETTALYASRINQADDVFASLESYINKLPVIGTKIQELSPNFLKSEDFQSYEQAQRNFLNAVLRRESGAVISPSEFDEGRKQYFPQAGDSQKVIEQKRQNRAVVKANFIKASGNAYVPYESSIGGNSGENAIYATNPETGQRIKSVDGGQNWESA